MSVRSNILAMLTLGPAYGLQLHAEIEARTARVGRINVGQIYSTITRLVDARLVVPVPRSDDTLPLYELTDAGRSEASAWVREICGPAPSWAEMVEQVLLVTSLPGVDPSPLLGGYRDLWAGVEARVAMPAAAAAADEADRQLAGAALAWLDHIRAARASGQLVGIPLSTLRPKRGRRPAARS